jgi:predicted permease
MDLVSLTSILVSILGPIVSVALMGYVLARISALDPRPLSRVTLYLFTPALVFTSAYRSKLGGELISITLFVLLITAFMGLLSLILIGVMHLDRMTASAFALSTLFVNAGNYGMPLNLFAFGEEGLARAIGFFVVSQILAQTLAVFIAARGTSSARDAVLNVIKMPLVYAVSLGLLFNGSGVILPDALIRTTDLMGGAAVPCMLVILGMELSRARWEGEQTRIALTAVVRLAAAPLLAFALAALMGLQSLTRAVCVLEASMPTAVTVSILAVEFRSRPEFVASAVLLTTIGSIISLTLLIAILR